MDSDTQDALEAGGALVFFCLELVCGATTLRFLDAPGAVTTGVGTFASPHVDYGVLVLPQEVVEGVQSDSPTLEFSIQPPDDEALADLLDLIDETATVRFWGPGVIDPDTGAPVADPQLLFAGFVNVTTATVGPGVCAAHCSAMGALAYLLDRGDGMSMNNPTHQSIRSGELGFEFITDVASDVYWGAAGPAAAAASVTPPSAVVSGHGLSRLLQQAALNAR